MDAIHRRYYLGPIVNAYLDAGHDARITRDGAMIVLASGTIKLGESPEFVPFEDQPDVATSDTT